MAELTALVPLGDRQVEMRKPTDGALVVLARIGRSLPNTKIENGAASPEVIEKLVRSLGTLGEIVETMIVKDDDRDWLDMALVGGSVSPLDIFDAIRVAGEKLNGGSSAGPAKKAPPVRRSKAR